jgi:hypothetical protein
VRRLLLYIAAAALIAVALSASASGSQARATSHTLSTECWTRDSYERYCHYDVYQRVPNQSYYVRTNSGNGYKVYFSVPYNTNGWVSATVLSSFCNGYGANSSFAASSGYEWVGEAIPCG